MNRLLDRTEPWTASDDRSVVARLRELDAFPGASTAVLRRIVAAGRVVPIPEGWPLILDLTPPDKSYIILAGSVSIRRDGVEVARRGAGDMVGERGVLRHRLRAGTVVAGPGLVALHLDREAVERLALEIPEFLAAADEAVDSYGG